LAYYLELSRDTAEETLRNLKSMGVSGSVPDKGYFIANTDFKQAKKVLLLFNKLCVHCFFVYNNNFSLFKTLLQNKKMITRIM